MELKKKVLGTLAAAALALSMVGSVAADDSAHGTVTLNPGTCQASIAESTANFGTWTYDGALDRYISDGNTTSHFNLAVHEARPGGTCAVTLQFSGLVSGSQNIGPNHFLASLTGGPSGTLPGGNLGPIPVAGGNYSGSLTLVSVPDNYQPGVYEGDLIVRVGVGS